MPEPITTATTTLAGASLAVPALTLLGVPLGLRADVLVAGFSGALVAIVLLNSVPGTTDTWRELLRTTGRRIAVAAASALTAGYLAPLTPASDGGLLGLAFVAGAGAQQVLRAAIERFGSKP